MMASNGTSAKSSLLGASVIAFTLWLLAFVPTAVSIRVVMTEPRSIGTHPLLACFALALATSLICLLTTVSTLAEHRFFVRISIIVLGVAGIVGIQRPGLHIPTWRVSEFVLAGGLTVSAVFLLSCVLRILRFRIASSAMDCQRAAVQFPLVDLFSIATAVAFGLAVIRASGVEWYSGDVTYYTHLTALSLSFTLTTVVTLAIVLGTASWHWWIFAVLIAPVGYLPATMVASQTLFAPWWCGALTATHTILITGLFIVLRARGIRLIRVQ